MIEKVGKYILEQSKSTSGYWLTRFVLLRFLGLIYLFAFISLATQVIPLIGSDGLLPADQFIDQVEQSSGSKLSAFSRLPTVFFFGISDGALIALSILGIIISLIVLAGFANSILLASLWVTYMSFVHIGQLWYSYGWEIQLLETGFLAIFLVPLLDLKPFPKTSPPVIIIWMFRWLAFRLYLGTGLIKMRGSECWKDFTCLFYHYETQPIPNGLSRYFHFMPEWFHKLGVLYSHFASLVAPFFIFWGKIGRYVAGSILILFQIILLTNGNYAFLNVLALVALIAVFDDKFFKKILPKFLVKKAMIAEKNAILSKDQYSISCIVAIFVIMLSVPVVVNLLSSNQAMNTSFNQLHIVNTYGAFGSIGHVRNELIIEGTHEEILSDKTKWVEYDFKFKPGPIDKIPVQIAPYQPRIDWQIWFAAMSTYENEPWLIHFVWKLLHNDEGALSLIDKNPFKKTPPQHVRILRYRYEFASLDDPSIWKRELTEVWLPPLSKNTNGLKDFIRANGWKIYE
jgi:hypothetical protein